jgi:hypothetical protein
MSYKQIPETTFGNTPAAMYLCRKLNEAKNPIILRSYGRRITGTFSQVKQLVEAYECGSIEPKTMANCLRLLREEVSAHRFAVTIEEQLCRNVQIGHIKRALRLAQVARKAARVMTSPENKSLGSILTPGDGGVMVDYFFRDSESGLRFKAGSVYTVFDADTQVPEDFTIVHRPAQESVDHITPEVLHARSIRRCIRLKKPHVTANN